MLCLVQNRDLALYARVLSARWRAISFVPGRIESAVGKTGQRWLAQIDRSIIEGERMARTVIQIAADPSYLYALCNDGQIFRLVNHVWQPMAPIPQDDQRETASRPRSGFLPIADEPAAETPLAGREPLSSRHARRPHPRRRLRRPLHPVPCSQAAHRTGLGT